MDTQREHPTPDEINADKVRRIVEVMETYRMLRTLSFIKKKLGETLEPSREEEAEAIIAELSR